MVKGVDVVEMVKRMDVRRSVMIFVREEAAAVGGQDGRGGGQGGRGEG